MKRGVLFFAFILVAISLSFFVSAAQSNVNRQIIEEINFDDSALILSDVDYNEVSNLNKELFDISSEEVGVVSRVASVFGVGKAVDKRNKLVSKSIERRTAMLKLADKRPDLFLTLTIPQEQQETVLRDAKPYLEKKTAREGTLQVLETPHLGVENNVNKTDEFQFFLKTTNKKYNLKFADGSIPREVSGARVKVEGVELGNYLATSSAETSAFEVLEESNVPRREENFGVQKIAIIFTKPVGGEDYDWPLLESHMQKVNEYFKEVSYGKVSLEWDVYGIYEVFQEYGGIVQITNPAIDDNVNFSKYSRVISVDERNCFGCAGVGMGNIQTGEGNLNMSVIWLTPVNFQNERYYAVVEHEMGHNFGAMHSNLMDCGEENYIDDFSKCNSYEYRDHFDVMGSNIYNSEQGHINSMYKEEITWINSSNTIQISSDGVYTIKPFENLSDELALKVPRKIDEFGNAKDFYYVEHRTPTGQDFFINEEIGMGPQVRIYESIENGPGGSPSQHIAMTPKMYPRNASIRDGREFFDPKTNVEIRTLDVNSENATIEVKVSDKQCVRREPTFTIRPLSISGTPNEVFYYSFELMNNDEGICDDREIWFNVSLETGKSWWVVPNLKYISGYKDYPSLIRAGEKVEGAIAVRDTNPREVGGTEENNEATVSIMEINKGIYATQNINYNFIAQNFEPVDFQGEDKARRFLYSRGNSDSSSYYLIDSSGKVYRRGNTRFTTDNGPEFSDGNYLQSASRGMGDNIILLDSEGRLYDVGEPYSVRLLFRNYEEIFTDIKDVGVSLIYYGDSEVVLLKGDGSVFYMYRNGWQQFYRNDYSFFKCSAWDGRHDVIREGVNHAVRVKPVYSFVESTNMYSFGYYVLSQDGSVYVCGEEVICEDGDDKCEAKSLNTNFTRFNQTLPADLGVGDRKAVAFDLDKDKGIVMLDSYGDVYTSGEIEYQGSPSFGEDIARDIQILPNGLGYGVLKGTGEIYECSNGACHTAGNACQVDLDCNDDNEYTEDKCTNREGGNYCEYQRIECIQDVDCNDNNERTIDSCIHPGTIESYCKYEEGPVCNNNGLCEEDNGENVDNCAVDCKVVSVECADSDGFDINTFGNVIDKSITYNDECVNGREVREYTCGKGFFRSEYKVKESVKGCQVRCDVGRCVEQDVNIQRACVDDDVNNDLTRYGKVFYQGQEYGDKCAESGLSVKQYFCADDTLRNFVKRCANGMRCGNGICS